MVFFTHFNFSRIGCLSGTRTPTPYIISTVMHSRDVVLKLREEGKSYGEISHITKIPKSTIAWICTSKDVLSRPVAKVLNWCEIQSIYNDLQSIRTTATSCGISKRSIEKATKRGDLILIKKEPIPIEELLVIDRPQTSRGHLKRRLLKEGLLLNQCAGCGTDPIWRDKPLVLQLEHKNGIKTDNRLENLELLCPNCHSQTDTFCGKNTKRKIKVVASPGLEPETPAPKAGVVSFH